jgi:hypothetical protein
MALVPVILKRFYGDRIKWLGGSRPTRDTKP